MPAKTRATILFIFVLIGSAIAFIGVTGGMAHSMEAGRTGSAHHISVLADGPPGFTGDGFTWG